MKTFVAMVGAGILGMTALIITASSLGEAEAAARAAARAKLGFPGRVIVRETDRPEDYVSN